MPLCVRKSAASTHDGMDVHKASYQGPHRTHAISYWSDSIFTQIIGQPNSILYRLYKQKYTLTRNIFKKDNRAQIKWKWFYWPFQGSASVLFASRLPLLYCLDVPYSLVVTGRVRVDLSALLRVMFPCVFCNFPIWCPLSEVILNCIDSWSLLSAVQTLIMSLDKKLWLILH